MSITRPDGSYSAVAKIFHWVSVPLIVLALLSGVVIGHVKDASKMGFYAVHESLGLTLLLLVLARLAWRRFHPPPPLPGHVPAYLRKASAATHHMLYAALVLQPVLGFFASNAFGFPMRGETAYLGLVDLPKFMDAWEGLAKPLMWLHGWLGWVLPVLIAAHVTAAIYHHAIRRDGTLMRML